MMRAPVESTSVRAGGTGRSYRPIDLASRAAARRRPSVLLGHRHAKSLAQSQNIFPILDGELVSDVGRFEQLRSSM
jgi:hypothetical protein